MAYYPFAVETGARYKLVGNGVTAVFNDPTDPDYVGVLTEITGLDSADVRESAEELTSADGGTHGDFYLGRRPITMNGRIIGHSTIVERNLRMDRAKRASLALRGDSVLSWEPSSRRENNLLNPSWELDALNWAGNGGSQATNAITRVTTRAVSGTASGRVTAAAATASGQTAYRHSNLVPTSPGKTFSFSVNVWNAGTANSVAARLRFLAANGTTTVSTSTDQITTTKGAWVPLSGTATIPAGATYVALDVIATSNATGQTFDFNLDTAILSPTTSVPTYFDGDTAGYYWQGVPHASESGDFIELFTLVRRQQPFRETGAWNKEFQMALVSEYSAIYSVGQQIKSGAGGAGIVCENRGSWPSYPILRITGASASNPTITNSTTGEVLQTTGGLIVAAGETLEIDTFNHNAYFTAGARNGQSANRYIKWDTSGWPTLLSGNNTLTLSGTGTLTVVWRDTWV